MSNSAPRPEPPARRKADEHAMGRWTELLTGRVEVQSPSRAVQSKPLSVQPSLFGYCLKSGKDEHGRFAWG